MNYKKIYESIVSKRKVQIAGGYTEIHHIVPRSLGGSDTDDNLVRLTAREHFICHLLLTRVHKDDIISYRKMLKAFFMMLVCKRDTQDRYISSRKYGEFRKAFAESQSIAQSGEKNSQYGKKSFWVWHEMYGKRRIDCDLLEDYISQGWFYGLAHKYVKPKATKKKIDRSWLCEWYEIYRNVGFEEFCKRTGYTKSKPNLVQQFSKHVDSFSPQNGKRRGC